MYRLKKHGYSAFLVGGCIRDLILGKVPKDFDITTNATPDQIQKIFRNCRLVGRRFRLAHILFGKEIIEVATFRGAHNPDEINIADNSRSANISRRSQSGMLLRDNVYGTIEQDAERRDFTLNAFYYSVDDFTIRDYCNGLQDLHNGVIRLIGDPKTRYREDPVRMLRAIRFAAKLNMVIEPQTAAPIRDLAPLLKNIPAARLFDESVKLLQTGYGFATYQLLREYQLFGQLFPLLNPLVNQQLTHTSKNGDFVRHPSHKIEQSHLEKMVELVLENTDTRIASGKRINYAFLFAAFFWYPIRELAQHNAMEGGLPFNDAFSMAIGDILTEQCRVMTIPRRLTTVMSDIWRLQLRMSKRSAKRVFAILEHPKYRAAYDLLEMRATIEKGELVGLAKWWNEFQSASSDHKNVMIKQLPKSNRSRAKH